MTEMALSRTILASLFASPLLSAPVAAEMIGVRPGHYQCWGEVYLQGAPGSGSLLGTYSDSYDAALGAMHLSRDAEGRWSGTWAEAEIGRGGRIFDVVETEAGFSASYDTTAPGTRRNGSTLGASSGPFSCRWLD